MFYQKYTIYEKCMVFRLSIVTGSTSYENGSSAQLNALDPMLNVVTRYRASHDERRQM